MNRFESIKEYFRQVSLGARNVHFFRAGSVPKLTKTFTSLEKKILVVAITALVVTSAFLISQSYVSVTEVVPDFGGKYVEGLVGQPRFINPTLSPANKVDQDISRIVFSGLIKFNADQQLVPDLAAEMPQISEDQKQYIIKLREDIVWHDGQQFTADDVLFTIKLIQDPQYQSPTRLNWNKVEVQKIDNFSIVIILKEPSAPFLTNLTQGILPKHIWESVEPANFALTKFNLQPVGTGPFVVTNIAKSDEGEIRSITLSSFENYKDGKPYLDEIVFKFYETYDDAIAAYHGRDIMGLGFIPFDKKNYVEKSSRINLHYLNLPQYQALFFNKSKSPVLNDKNVRYALAQSIDREEIINAIYFGKAQSSRGPIPPGYIGYNPGVEESHLYNIENAKALLSASEFIKVDGTKVLKKGDVDLEFTLTTNNFPPNVAVAELLKKQWEKIGFQINLEVLTIGELEQDKLRPREYQSLLFIENVGADPDPFPFWHSTQRQDPGLNLAIFGSREADALLEEARTNADPAYRDQRYKRFQEILVDDMPAIFVANSLFIYGINDKIQGVELNNIVNQSERFLDIDKWYLNTKRAIK
ncbi:MAG: hypothetical protein COT91_01540 [Candidatus Doudnabacteria bacterium CG10_big_fil_rev_8_21_14_0_10_41_10]|uniref:Solute-binding protein family 5 domain-containing protein n=1 Tax=Candidatus Doudnabacteria bacterium CG10_big_fil_rev_8_21_14_0_10_41_10 TaxID=1974551 RepID=A0A2H0VGC4_9BACT|nr:MAG: hypothetical protein COT91_01540 [Candidatus Doudnabacteria bacterium CG10_big_fil_rev_8_21_14_0_10_41_10]